MSRPAITILWKGEAGSALGTSEILQWSKCLLYKCGELGSNPQKTW